MVRRTRRLDEADPLMWTISYGPYCMLHVLCSIFEWPDDMSHGSEFLFSVDSEVSEIDTNDWSEWIIENYFSWFCRTENIYFLTQRKRIFKQKTIFRRKIGNLKSQELIFVFVKKNTDIGQPRPGDPWQEKIYERKHNRKWIRIKRGNCWKEHLFYFQFIFFWNLPFGLSSLILLHLKYPILVFENFLTTVRMFQFRIFQFCHR